MVTPTRHLVEWHVAIFSNKGDDIISVTPDTRCRSIVLSDFPAGPSICKTNGGAVDS